MSAFARAYTPNRVNYFPGEFWTYRRMVDREECKHLLEPDKKRERDNIIKEYGRRSSYVQSMVFGRFTASAEGNVIYQEEHLNALRDSMLRSKATTLPDAQIRAGGDISQGKDKMVLMIRQGTEILWIDEHMCDTDIEQADYWVRTLKHLGIAPWQFCIDGGGAGATVANYMELRLDYQGVNRFLANNAPTFDFQFVDRYTEIHFGLRAIFPFIKMPFCRQLLEDARQRLFVEMGKDKIKTEPKKEHRKRLKQQSPDFLDTLVYTFSDFPFENFIQTGRAEEKAKGKKPDWMNQLTPMEREALAGDRLPGLQGIPRQPSLADIVPRIRRRPVGRIPGF